MNEMTKTDSRVRRTEARLHRSLGVLIHEKSYDDIVVKEILARANVARSTFYAHFNGKEELLLSSIRHMLAAARDRVSQSSDRVETLLHFSLPLLQHIEGHIGQSSIIARRSDQRQLHERLEHALTEHIEADIRRVQRDRPAPEVPAELLAKHLSTAFLGVLEWWLRRRPAPTAHDAHEMYRALVDPVLRKLK